MALLLLALAVAGVALLVVAPWKPDRSSRTAAADQRGGRFLVAADPAEPGPLQRLARDARRAPPTRIPGRGAVTAIVSRPVALRARPGGRVIASLPPRTEFGSRRVLAVVARRHHGLWLAVRAAQLPNGRIGWIDGRLAQLYRVPWTLAVDLSRRLLTVRHDGRVVRRSIVAVGRPGAETPPGRYAVTDKLLLENRGSSYGCCVLALTGHQPHLQQGWGGGDRLAIHSTDNPTSIGRAASLGCIRAPEALMHRLVYDVPLGARVQIVR